MRQEPVVYVNGDPVCARPADKIGEYAELGNVTRKSLFRIHIFVSLVLVIYHYVESTVQRCKSGMYGFLTTVNLLKDGVLLAQRLQ